MVFLYLVILNFCRFYLENLAINGHRNNFLHIWFVVLNNAMNHSLKSTFVCVFTRVRSYLTIRQGEDLLLY